MWCKTGQHRSGQVERALGSGAIGALALGQMLPAALLAGVRMLLQKGINIDQGASIAKRALSELTSLRQQLQKRLEQELRQMEQWWQGGEQQQPTLRLQAQNLADQLAAIDELESQLQKLLKQSTESE